MKKMRARSSGTSDQLPTLLKYPFFLPYGSGTLVKDVFCYVLRHYGQDGFTVLVARQPQEDSVAVVCGDLQGNTLDLYDKSSLSKLVVGFLNSGLKSIVELMSVVQIPQAQYFFGLDEQEPVLLDIQIALDKFAGPGMVGDLFGKQLRTQEVLKVEIIDDRAAKAIEQGTGSYEGDLVLKPSKFRMCRSAKDKSDRPLYVEVTR